MADLPEPRWFVLCLDDSNVYTFATHGSFATEQDAFDYVVGLAPSRNPLVVYASKPFYERT